MELDCICGHCKEIHYGGQLASGRFVCLTDNCECKDYIVKEN
jgi:hypothetical protein